MLLTLMSIIASIYAILVSESYFDQSYYILEHLSIGFLGVKGDDYCRTARADTHSVFVHSPRCAKPLYV